PLSRRRLVRQRDAGPGAGAIAMNALHTSTALRVLTLNLWNRSGDIERRMDVALAGVPSLQPRLLGLHEGIEGPGGRPHAGAFPRAGGGDFRSPAADPDSPGGPIGNAVVSRLPIGASASVRLPGPEHDPRVALAVEVTTPLGPLCYLSTHLSWEL